MAIAVDLGGIIDQLAALIGRTVKTEYELMINFKTEAKNLFSSLMVIQTVMEEADKRQLTDPRVRDWLGRLQDLVFEIDDVLDKWKTETSRRQTQRSGGGEAACCNALKRVTFCSWCTYIRKRRAISLSIKELIGKADLMAEETPKYPLLPINYYTDNNKEALHQISTSFTNVVTLDSQEKQKESLLLRLLEKTEENVIQVFTLLGIVGIGKTTLAQLLFRDPTLESLEKLWITVPYTFDKIWVAKAILDCLGINYPENAALQKLLELIKSNIEGKKFLLVLDNVWQEDDNMWRQLKASLDCGHRESRIVATTRNENVANMIGGIIIKVEGLSGNEECMSLFEKVAFRGKDKKKNELMHFAEIIVGKCGNLPFVVKTLGDYLGSKFTDELWCSAAHREFWQLQEVAEALFAPLAFTYTELPLAVKHYLSYIAIFPRDDPINVDELNRIWTVKGSLSSGRTDAEMETEGHGYFDKLKAQSFFQDVRPDTSGRYYEWFKMNSLIYNFVQYLAHSGRKAEKPRCFYSGQELTDEELDGSLQSLRVLIMKRGQRHTPSEKIGNLIHLRYLSFGWSSVDMIPKNICKLYNLHTLDLRYCNLSQLPRKIHRLRNLRHLWVGGNPELRDLPEGVRKLTALKTLDEFKAEKSGRFEYLRNLNELQGSMTIYLRELQKENNVQKARGADLESKLHLENLHFAVSWVMGPLQQAFQHLPSVMEALQPPPQLKSLGISGYRRNHAFPRWISRENLRCLTVLKIEDCWCLPALGALPSLEELYVRNMISMDVETPLVGALNLLSLGINGYKLSEYPEWIKGHVLEGLKVFTVEDCLCLPPDLGALPSLEKLIIRNMESLESIDNHKFLGSSLVAFPKMNHLELSGCLSLNEWKDIDHNEHNYTSIMPNLTVFNIASHLEKLPNFIHEKIPSEIRMVDGQLHVTLTPPNNL